jgi:hypothetical protein
LIVFIKFLKIDIGQSLLKSVGFFILSAQSNKFIVRLVQKYVLSVGPKRARGSGSALVVFRCPRASA